MEIGLTGQLLILSQGRSPSIDRHCERSEAIQSAADAYLDCRAGYRRLE